MHIHPLMWHQTAKNIRFRFRFRSRLGFRFNVFVFFGGHNFGCFMGANEHWFLSYAGVAYPVFFGW